MSSDWILENIVGTGKQEQHMTKVVVGGSLHITHSLNGTSTYLSRVTLRDDCTQIRYHSVPMRAHEIAC